MLAEGWGEEARGVIAAGFGVAVAAAACYETAYVLQALEARAAEPGLALSASLLRRLAHRPRWLAGMALTAFGGGLQVLALRLAPLTVVQPTLSLGLVVLVVLAGRFLGERIGARERLAVLAIVVGVVAIALAAPRREDAVPAGAAIPAVMVPLGALVAGPFLLRRWLRDPRIGVVAAATGDAWAALAIKLVADELGRGRWTAAVAWALGAGIAGSLSLTGEMSALQRLPATRVAPLVLAATVVIPVGVAPVIADESWGSTALGGAVLALAVPLVGLGAAVLGTSGAVGGVLASGESRDRG